MKRILLIYILLIVSLIANAQYKTIYFDAGKNITDDATNALFYGFVKKLDSGDLILLKKYDRENNLVHAGTFKDEALKIPQGSFTYYNFTDAFNALYQTNYPKETKKRFVNETGNFLDGKKDGLWSTYFPDGKIRTISAYLKGVREGDFRQFDNVGKVVIAGQYKSDFKEGLWQNENGASATYKKGVITESVAASIAPTSQVKSIYFYGDQLTTDKDKATSYAVYGKLSSGDIWTFKRYDLYDNLLQTGSYTDESLTVADGNFVFYMDVDNFNSFYKTNFYLKNKTRFVSQQGKFVNGLEQGKWILFYPDGNIFNSQDFVAGKMHGEFKTFTKKGEILISGNYVNGLQDGVWFTDKGKTKEVYEMGVLKLKERVKKAKTVEATVTNN